MTQHLGAGQSSSSQMGHHRLSQGLGGRRKCQSWLLLTVCECALKEDPVSSRFGLLLPGNSLKMQCTSTTKGWVGDWFLFKTVTRTGPYSSWLEKTEKGGNPRKMGNKYGALLSWSSLGHLGWVRCLKIILCQQGRTLPIFITIMTYFQLRTVRLKGKGLE